MIQRIKLTINVVFFTLIVATSMSYLTKVVDLIPDLNILECAGIYCLWLPIHNLIKSIGTDE